MKTITKFLRVIKTIIYRAKGFNYSFPGIGCGCYYVPVEYTKRDETDEK